MNDITIKNNNKNVKLSKSDLTKSWLTWISFGQICYNYERMMGLGFAHSMSPLFKKLYKNDKEKLADGLTRHLTFYNTENTWGSVILGIVASLEEEKANGENITNETISSMKTALMGPIAGIGDSITQALVKVILLGIAIDFALKGNPTGAVIFILGMSLYALIVSRIMFNSGYKLGKNSVVQLLREGSLSKITESLGVVGMMVLGALVSGNMNLKTPLTFKVGEVVSEVQPMLDSILPNLLNLVAFGFVYHLLQKRKISANKIILIIFALAFVLKFTGIM